MSDSRDLSKLEGEKNPFNKYNKKYTNLKIWAITLASIVVLFVLFFLAKSLLIYTLAFNTLGGSEVESQKLTFLEIMKVPDEIPTKPGYYLAGWTKDKDGNEPFPFGDKIWWSTTAYAKWEEGVAIVLEFADGEENADLSTAELKSQYEEWLKPGLSDELPLVKNQNENSIHYGERLLWFETPECDGDPIYTKTYSLSESVTVYGKWFEDREEKFDIDENGVLINYDGYCKNLILPASVKSIRGVNTEDFIDDANDQLHTDESKQSVFKNVMSSVESIYLNDQLEVIGECAFRSCSKLSRVEFLNGKNSSRLKSIGGHAFFGTKLTSFDIPDTVESIGEYAFRNLGTLTFVSMGTGVKTIGDYAFTNTNIKSVTLKNVQSLGILAFGSCNQLEEIYLLSPQKINVVGVGTGDREHNVLFSSGTLTFKIYIPNVLMGDYQSDSFWRDYRDNFWGYDN